MNKAVLLSIQPKWCELIANGKKTVEVRKSKPTLKTPFKCYIYETKGVCEVPQFIDEDGHTSYRGRGQVIGEFVCYYIDEFQVFNNGAVQNWNYYDLEKSGLTYEEIATYIGRDNIGYIWHISELKIYDTPKELSEFKRPCDRFLDCFLCRRHIRDEFGGCDSKIRRPPQSYMYVEEI